jgi:hypothetical protein
MLLLNHLLTTLRDLFKGLAGAWGARRVTAEAKIEVKHDDRMQKRIFGVRGRTRGWMILQIVTYSLAQAS